MDKENLDSIVKWLQDENTDFVDIMKDYINPTMEAFGDDVGEIIKYLDGLDKASLLAISGIFEFVYGKFMTEDVWEALTKLEEKIKN